MKLAWAMVYDGTCPICKRTYCHGAPFLETVEEGETPSHVCCFDCLAKLIGKPFLQIFTWAASNVFASENPQQMFESLGWQYDDGLPDLDNEEDVGFFEERFMCGNSTERQVNAVCAIKAIREWTNEKR